MKTSIHHLLAKTFGVHRSLITIYLLAFISAFPLFSFSAFSQGSLTPPGTPAPTMKTLDQVEARTIVNAANTPGNATNTFIISQPGSYYLTGNITGASGKHGISIQANDVTLDLNGFALISGGGGAFRGVNVPAAQTNLCVRNGSVRGWTDGGVRADADVTLAEKLLLANNAGATGLAVGNGSLIKDCVASGNGTGFVANDRTQVISCISTVNTGNGFTCTSYVTIIDCTSSRNGADGIHTGSTCNIIRCSATHNIPSGYGIRAGSDCAITNCTAGDNGSDGIGVDSFNVVQSSVCSGNGGAGIHMIGFTNRIDGNFARNNASYGINSACQGCDYIMRNACTQNNGATTAIASPNYNPNVGSYFGTFSTPGASTPSPWANF
jgi:Right handed beta helix region